MGSRIRPLLAWILIVACLQAGPASASGFSAGSNAAGFLGGLGLLPEPLSDALDWWDRVDKARDLLEDAQTCAAAGLSSSTCADVVWAGVCTAYLELGIEAAPQFQLLGLPFDKLCEGEPTLKCCKYEPATQNGCHTAFNSPAPINCEGNWTRPNAKSYGPCLSINDPLNLGCTCCGIAECFTPACAPASLTDPVAAAWRTDTFAKKISTRRL